MNRPLLRSPNLNLNSAWDDVAATCKEFPPVALEIAPGFTYPWFGALIIMSSEPIMIVPTARLGAVIWNEVRWVLEDTIDPWDSS